jgi:hypothetical protein
VAEKSSRFLTLFSFCKSDVLEIALQGSDKTGLKLVKNSDWVGFK